MRSLGSVGESAELGLESALKPGACRLAQQPHGAARSWKPSLPSPVAHIICLYVVPSGATDHSSAAAPLTMGADCAVQWGCGPRALALSAAWPGCCAVGARGARAAKHAGVANVRHQCPSTLLHPTPRAGVAQQHTTVADSHHAGAIHQLVVVAHIGAQDAAARRRQLHHRAASWATSERASERSTSAWSRACTAPRICAPPPACCMKRMPHAAFRRTCRCCSTTSACRSRPWQPQR